MIEAMNDLERQNDDRSAELADNLNAIRDQIKVAAQAIGRDPSEVSLTVVTKTYPVDDVVRLYRLGVKDFAENRDQEAAPKAATFAEFADAGDDVTWHFVGQAQTNKTNSIVRYARVVESVDRPKLARALDKSATNKGIDAISCLIQVNLDPDAPQDRGGAQPDSVSELADVIAQSDSLNLGGVMAVAPLGADPAQSFEKLAKIHQKLLQNHPEAGMMSAGMSSDFELAIKFGATHVRLGAAVLGQRESLR
ncbi:MAG: YggS family pyridoxal phosphate-dependent enzyme [Candidatus Nanopelagicales bacterium]